MPKPVAALRHVKRQHVKPDQCRALAGYYTTDARCPGFFLLTAMWTCAGVFSGSPQEGVLGAVALSSPGTAVIWYFPELG